MSISGVHIRPRSLQMRHRRLLDISTLAARIRAMGSVYQHRSFVLRPRYIERRVCGEEVSWPQMELMDLHWHDWPVLHSRIMRESKHIPDNNVFVLDVVVPRNGISNAVDFFLALVCELAAGPELAVFVLSYPHVMLRELCALGDYRVRVCQQWLSCRWYKFVADGLLGNGVYLGGIGHLNRAVRERRCVEVLRSGDRRLTDFIAIAPWVDVL